MIRTSNKCFLPVYITVPGGKPIWCFFFIIQNVYDIKKAKKELEDTFFEDIRITKKYVTEGILKNIKGAEAKFDYAVSLKGYAMLAQLYDLNDDKKNDRMIINEKENIALLENLKKRIVDVTPALSEPC